MRRPSPSPQDWISSNAFLHGLRVTQVQAHPAHVSLVSDGLGVEFEHHRISEFLREFDGLFGSRGHLRGDGGNTVGPQKPLGFDLREDGPS